jgi:hypothetical protein
MPFYRLIISAPAYYQIEVEAEGAEEAAAVSLSRRAATGLTFLDYGALKLESVTLSGDTPRRAKYRRQSRKRKWYWRWE